MPEFVSPFATAVTVNRLHPFSIRPPPNRACNFRSTRLSSSRKSLGFGDWHHAYLLPRVPVNLPPFAMRTAFPSSDYYGGSVTLGLVPCRRS
jgi:hypothetical protein